MFFGKSKLKKHDLFSMVHAQSIWIWLLNFFLKEGIRC